jgi:hypothetical protein
MIDAAFVFALTAFRIARGGDAEVVDAGDHHLRVRAVIRFSMYDSSQTRVAPHRDDRGSRSVRRRRVSTVIAESRDGSVTGYMGNGGRPRDHTRRRREGVSPLRRSVAEAV